MTRSNLIVDGWLLQQHGHGTASFARTLTSGLATAELRERVQVAIPDGSGAEVPAGLAKLALPPGVVRTGVVGEALWQNRLGAWVSDHGEDNVLLALALFSSNARPSRSLVVCHDLIPVRFPRYLGRFRYRRWLFDRQVNWLHNATCIVCDSRHTAAEVHERLGAGTPRVVTIPLWTALADVPQPSLDATNSGRARYGLPRRYWLYVGGYDYRKNVEFLIDAYARVAKDSACPRLVLAGTIPTDLRKPICDVAGAIRRNGLASEAISFPGFIAAEDLAAVYAGAELFIYPSAAEGFGLPPVEAMATGCPAVVADATSLPEVVTDAGYRFSIAGVEPLIEILRAAAVNPMPVNPGFERRLFGSARGLSDYEQVIASVMSA